MEKIEIEKVIKLTPIDRYKYFIKRIADKEILFTLELDDKIITSNINNKTLIPLWNATEYVKLCQVEGWENSKIKQITLEQFENEIIDLIEENDYLINIFPVGGKTGFVVDINEFVRDLNDELNNY